jgi:hypothetical protein
MAIKNSANTLEIIEAFNYSLLIGNIYNDYLKNNNAIKYKKSTAKKLEKAIKLLNEIHLDLHSQFVIVTDPNNYYKNYLAKKPINNNKI